MAEIDLNCDLGEGFGPWRMADDAALLAIASSANIACGFHAGDPKHILATLHEAARRDISVGAHIGYPDLRGFGRRRLDVTRDELFSDTLYQIGALQALARAAGTRVRYVKPHGALYNTMARDADQAGAVIAAMRALDPALFLVAPAGMPVMDEARHAGIRTIAEAFADRAYAPDLSLVSRRQEGAVLRDTGEIVARALRMVTEGRVTAIDGSDLRLQPRTLCIHGDTPGATAIARALRNALRAHSIAIRPFARD